MDDAQCKAMMCYVWKTAKVMEYVLMDYMRMGVTEIEADNERLSKFATWKIASSPTNINDYVDKTCDELSQRADWNVYTWLDEVKDHILWSAQSPEAIWPLPKQLYLT